MIQLNPFKWGGGSKTVTNPYNDQWIKQTFADQKVQNQIKTKKNKIQDNKIKKLNVGDKKQDKKIKNLGADIKAAEKKLKNKVGEKAFKEYKKNQNKKYDKLTDQIKGLKGGKTKIGDVKGLDDYLTNLTTQFDDSSAEITALQDLQTQLQAADLEQGQATADIQAALTAAEGNLSTLTSDFAGLESDLGDLETTLKSDYESQISDLSDTFDVDLEEVYAKFDEEKLAFEDYQTKAAQDLTDVQTALETQFGEGYDDLTSGLADLQSATDQQFLDVYKTGEEAIQSLDEKFAGQLQDQSTSLQEQIEASAQSTEDKIGQVAALQNYRMIGDSAGGIKMRRSKAYSSGAVNMGTGQLSRSMKLQTLNL